ncbi:hypothetical protein EWM64_g4196 [Hericium alpestre]|uniref:Major facilitator superfamily (MFS) profile domain-containing protein n=1 Tax=Hericium alpestre TaxID=135208 RepID=A0A4Y9ZY47_9AGAM|nr:hypothetical protein EWM64_g4196 [Hericium alpestre]
MGKKRTAARRAAAAASTATTAPPPSVSVAPEDDAVACDHLEPHTAPAQQQHDAHAANTWPEPRVSSLVPSTSSLVPHTTTETAQGVSVVQDAVTCPHTVANGPERHPPITIANPHDPRSPNAYHARRTASPTSHTHTASPNDAPTPLRRTARIPAADNEPNELFAACPADSPDKMDANTPHTPTAARLVQQAPSAAFTVYTAAGFVAFLGLYTVLTYIDASAPSQGVDENLTFYLVSVANAASGFGRLASGFAADRFGAMNIMAPMTALAGIMTYIWPFVHGQGPVAAVAVIYGLASGAFVSLLAAPMIAFGEASDVGRRTGMFMTTLSIGALAGPPISGAINTATGGYKAVGIYAGSAVMVATALMYLARQLVLKGATSRKF